MGKYKPHTDVNWWDIHGRSATGTARCIPCQPCLIGQELLGCGLGEEGNCTFCELGWHKDTGALWAPAGKQKAEWDTPCIPNQPCPAGFYRLGSVPHWEGDCLPCALHTYKNESGVWNQTCLACPDCDPGFFRDGCGGPTAGTCTACQAGLMQTQASSYPCTSCQACAAGDYLASDSNP